MIRPALRSLALLLALAGPAAAQTAAPALRAHVMVDSEVVRIGDLVENAGPVADIPVFRAPDLGTTGAVATENVVDAIRPHQLIDIDTRGLSEVIVTRLSRAISTQEISARIARALAGQNGLSEARNIAVNFDGPVLALQVEPNAGGELQVSALYYDPRTSRFDVTLDLPSSLLLHRQSPRFTGTAIETVDAVAVDHPVERGEVLQAADLTVTRRPKTQASGITDIGAATGLAARHQLRPGQPLTAADLMKPEIVQRNDTVTLVYEAPGLTLTLRGQAQDAGALGDTISVLNAETKRAVQGVVTGPGRVNVGAATTQVVENAPVPARSPEPAETGE
jgi:flagellar basal body P-ring formation protein FlgA